MTRLDARPRFLHARLRRRGEDVLLLAPERGLVLRGSAAEILGLVDGTRTVADIIDALAQTHPEAGADAIRPDVVALLDELVRRRLVELEAPAPAAKTPVEAPAETAATTAAEAPRESPMTLIAELTYACPLRCAYCSNPVGLGDVPTALTTADWLRVFGEAEALGVVQLHLTGGEPLLRRDLEELVAGARARDLYINLITSGVPLRRERLAALRAAGVDAVQISFQDATGACGERIAGVDRHRDKLAAAGWVRELGIPLTINVVLHALNIDEIGAIIHLAEELGADRLELANTQYLGWALANRAALLPSAAQMARAREIAAEARQRLAGRMELLFVLPDHHRGRPRACMGGWARQYLVVNPDGIALPCHAARDLPLEFWNVRDRSLDAIWRGAPGFEAFRGEAWMVEPCRSCDRRDEDHGGCRCQAFALTGDAAAADPACALAPDHDLVRLAASVPGAAIQLRVARRRAEVSPLPGSPAS